jgi:RHS repeat-associated protein
VREDTGTAPGLTSLPQGSGVSPLGDRFEPDLVRGSGSYAISFPVPKGPNNLQPSLGLSYSTGSGNGPFGMGWRTGLPRIERRTDRGIPTYDDEADTFVIGDGEELLPIGGGRYRPRTDTKFWSIAFGANGWTVRTGEGTTMRFGQTTDSQEGDGARIFAWLLDEQEDAAGNIISYGYLRDGNRLYPEQIAWSVFAARFVYEDRADVLRNARAGFLRVTGRRAKALEISSQRAAPPLLRTYSLEYESASSGLSRLKRVSLSATVDDETATLPAVSFTYADFDPSRWQVDPLRSEIPPPAGDDPATQWVDMTGDGLPDLLSVSERTLLWRNRGDGSFDGPSVIDEVPAQLTLGRANVAFADVNGDGRVDLFAVDQPLQLAYTADGKGGFAPDPIIFRDRPTLRLAANDTRLTDLDGDGVTDLLSTGLQSLLLFHHVPGRGWQEPVAVPRVHDLDRFPDVTLSDRGVMLADLTGDGLSDVFFLRSGQAWYWPSLGNGNWDRLVEMAEPPQFPPGYREDRIVVTDIDGDGCVDVLYLDADRTIVWLNRAGQGFSAPIEIPAVPPPQARVFTLDPFGDGRSAVVWSGPASIASDTGYRVLRLDAGTSPNLLTSVRNGMGRVISMEYSTSAVMRRSDRDDGADWLGLVPFIVPVVTTIRDEDEVVGSESSMTIRYHDGVYDGPRREFRGFSRVTVNLDGDGSIPASRQEYRFFQGDPEETDLIERDRQRALAGTQQTISAFALSAGPPVSTFETAQTWEVAVTTIGPGVNIFTPRLVRVVNREFGAADPDRVERIDYSDFDPFGNAQRTVHEWIADGAPPESALSEEERVTFLADEANWLIKVPVRRERRDGSGTPLAVEIYHYDGPAFQGLAEGSATCGLLTRTQTLVLRAAALPEGYADAVDLTTIGYERLGAGDLLGFYATTFAVERDARGNIVGRRDPIGAETTFTYDADGVFPTASIDARGRPTTAVFDPRACSPRVLVSPDGRSCHWTFDPLGRQTARFELDDAGVEQLVAVWTVAVDAPPCAITAITPRHPGRSVAELRGAADPGALADVSVSRSFLDGAGNVALAVATAADAPDGTMRFVASRRLRRNTRGLVSIEYPAVFVADLGFTPPPPAGPETARHFYDARGNRLETTGPGPVHVRTSRDTFAQRHFEGAVAVPVGGNPPGDPTRVERFDARSRAVRIEELQGDGTAIITSYEITADGQIAVIRDTAGAVVTQYFIAGPGDAVRITHRDAGTRTYYRDARGLLRRMIAADNGKLLYEYDPAGRVTRIQSQNPEQASVVVREYVYDADPTSPGAPFLDGRIAVVTEPAYTMRLRYDRAGHETGQTIEAGGVTLTTRKEYGLQGDLDAAVYPDDERIAFTRDRSGALTAISGILDRTTYDAEGRLAGYTFANGMTCGYPRDPVSRRLIEASAQTGAGTLRRLAYSYDAVGNIVGIADTMAAVTVQSNYDYDGLHRVVRFETTPAAAGRSGQYVYDAAGNVQQFQETRSATLAYTDPMHPGHLTSVSDESGTVTLTYDARGRVSSFGELTSIEYDALDRVSKIIKADGTEIRLSDDHLGRPVLREVTNAGGAVSRVVFAGDLYERHASKSIRHIYVGTARVARQVVTAATEVSYFLTDHHGTTVLETDAAGAIVASQRYSPFGQILVAGVALNRYADRDADADTHLFHFGARLYVPQIGRFLSPDWYVLENPDRAVRMPQGYNVYSYAMNNPLAFTDPSGQWFFIPFIVGFTVGLIYGYADGRGADGAWSLAKETAMTTGIGFNLGWMTGMFAPIFGGPLLASIFGAMGGLNGLLTGTREIYDDVQFLKPEGLASLIADSSWGILGTSLGNALNIYNLIAAPSSYRSDLSKRQNRQVYDAGFNIKTKYAFTQGNTISNMAQGKPIGTDPQRLLHHESVHIFQNRAFGPFYQLTYVAWLAVFGVGVGSVRSLWYTAGGEKYDWVDAFQDTGYFANPWEQWAYAHGGDDNPRHHFY